jgi:hypothetical protein
LLVTDDSIVASARLGQSLGGKRAVSGGVSVEGLLEFVDEDCCQAEQLVEFDVAVSVGITPRVCFILRTK